MKVVVGAIALGTILVSAACESGSDDSATSSYPSSYGAYDACQQYASCGTCTPVYGCGWCFDSNGAGQCAADPSACATPTFGWTWNPDGCRVAADAGSVKVAPFESDAAVAATDAAADALEVVTCGRPSGTVSSPVDGGLADGSSDICTSDPGSNLCQGWTYAVRCGGSATPRGELGCSILALPTPMDELFYCCPCVPDVETK